jgi:hypothetical protein
MRLAVRMLPVLPLRLRLLMLLLLQLLLLVRLRRAVRRIPPRT